MRLLNVLRSRQGPRVDPTCICPSLTFDGFKPVNTFARLLPFNKWIHTSYLWVMSSFNPLIFSTTFSRLTNVFTRIGPISLVTDSAKSLPQYSVKYTINVLLIVHCLSRSTCCNPVKRNRLQKYHIQLLAAASPHGSQAASQARICRPL